MFGFKLRPVLAALAFLPLMATACAPPTEETTTQQVRCPCFNETDIVRACRSKEVLDISNRFHVDAVGVVIGGQPSLPRRVLRCPSYNDARDRAVALVPRLAFSADAKTESCVALEYKLGSMSGPARITTDDINEQELDACLIAISGAARTLYGTAGNSDPR